MFLKTLTIENFRAISKTELTFNSTTVWIGENESGKSSIIEALSMLLDPEKKDESPVFQKFQFHRNEKNNKPAGLIKIRLFFSEKQLDEWNGKTYSPINHLLKQDTTETRSLYFEVTADFPSAETVKADWFLSSPELNKKSSDPKLLLWLRQKVPVIHLAAGMLTGRGIENIPFISQLPIDDNIPESVTQNITTIQSTTSAILTGTTTNVSREIESGYKAARNLFKQLSQHSETKKLGLTQKVGEILGRDHEKSKDDSTALPPEFGNSSQRLGALLLVSALLRANTQGLNREMEPIWIIENPEAHLHPITLASVSFLINQIRWQKILTTYSSNLLSNVPLRQVRRLVRFNGNVKEFKIDDKNFSGEDLRKISYHFRTRHGIASFARLWLLVEGESEFWMIPQLARLLGYDFSLEGIRCIDFAQSGLSSLIKVAEELGIKWHLLADGDKAGQAYINVAKRYMHNEKHERYITLLKERDIEHSFYKNGYAEIFRGHAKISKTKAAIMKPSRIINQAIKFHSKPFLALSIAEAAAEAHTPEMPKELIDLINVCVMRAREKPF